MQKLSYYEVLGVESTATSQEIMDSYKKLAASWHPDKCSNWVVTDEDKSDITEVFKYMTTARDSLKDPVSRRRYDAAFIPISTTASDELLRIKWERLNHRYKNYIERMANPQNYVAFMQSHITELNARQRESLNQIKTLTDHLFEFQPLVEEKVVKFQEQEALILLLQTRQRDLEQRNASLEKQLKDKTAQLQRQEALVASLQSSQKHMEQEKASLEKQLRDARSQIEQLQPKVPVQTNINVNVPLSTPTTFQFYPPSKANITSNSSQKLAADGMLAIHKLIEHRPKNQGLEWYWVALVFENDVKAAEFKDRYYQHIKMSNSRSVLRVVFNLGYSANTLTLSLCDLQEIRDCEEKTGMIMMRELSRYIDITKVPQYFFDDRKGKGKIEDADLPEQFISEFLRFDDFSLQKSPHLHSLPKTKAPSNSSQKLAADSMTAILKLIQPRVNNQGIEWYWVHLVFESEAKTKEFRDRYLKISNDDSLVRLYYSSYPATLELKLNGSEEAYKCEKKTGMIMMRELSKVVDINRIPQYFTDIENRKIIKDADLPEQFINEFLKFDVSSSQNTPSI